jgi:hypothetical protein
MRRHRTLFRSVSPICGQLIPMTDAIEINLGRKPEQLSADAGYCSEANLEALENRNIDAYVETGRARDAVAGPVTGEPTAAQLSPEPAGEPTRVERPPRPERGALPATAPFRLWTLSRSLLADNFRLMALDHRGPRQSDLWSASPSDKSPFLAVRSDRDQHVISLILASTVIVKTCTSGHRGVQL